MSLYDICPDGIRLYIYAQPSARKSCIDGEYNDRIKVKLASPPVDGKANRELIRYLSSVLLVSRSRLDLIQGDKSRQKTVFVEVSDTGKESVISKIIEELKKV